MELYPDPATAPNAHRKRVHPEDLKKPPATPPRSRPARRVFEVLDEDGSGQVTTEEFDAAFEIRECRRGGLERTGRGGVRVTCDLQRVEHAIDIYFFVVLRGV